MDALELLESHRHLEAVEAAGLRLSVDPHDWAAVGILASAYRALGQYDTALQYFERIGKHEREDPIAPGSPGRLIDISCLHWCLEEREQAILLMKKLVTGICDGSIKFADAAGGVQQGLLLFYMECMVDNPTGQAFSIDYLRGRLKRPASRLWPGPVAKYLLDEIGFLELLAAATGAQVQSVADAKVIAKGDLLVRRRLCVALFYDGVRAWRRGARAEFASRMRDCCSLEDPLIEPEWYLAKYESERAAAIAK